MAYSSVEVASLDAYVNAVSSFTARDELLLRGHQCASWKLVPSLSRLELRGATASRIEVETRLMARFKRQALPYLRHDPANEWDWLALAQHHGLATRLLDWTSSPLAALWFVVRHPAVNDEDGVVFLFAPSRSQFVDTDAMTNPYAVPRTMFFRPAHITERIVVQQGWFSVHKYGPETRRFTQLDHLSPYRERIQRLVIPADRFSTFRWDLDRMGTNEASLFPDLDGLSRHLDWTESRLSDEPAPGRGLLRRMRPPASARR